MIETISIQGMHCSGCVAGVKRAMERLGVTSADVTIGSATVEYDSATLSHEQIVGAIEDAGYVVAPIADAEP